MCVQSTLNGRSKALNGNFQGDAQLFPKAVPDFFQVSRRQREFDEIQPPA